MEIVKFHKDKCAACLKYRKAGEKLILFSNPEDDETRAKWIHNLCLPELYCKTKFKICSAHFDEKSFKPKPLPHMRQLLIRNAIPTKIINTDREQLMNLTKYDIIQNHENTTVQLSIQELKDIQNVMTKNSEKLKQSARELKNLKRQLGRRDANIEKMKGKLKECLSCGILSDNEYKKLRSSINSLPGSLFKTFVKNQDINSRLSYTNKTRKFAKTLHFYSPKAYSYVRSAFNNALPHPKTICSW